jgi:protein-tyrosine phosphatase
VIRLVTVCTGNICRSPMAEQVLRSALAEAGLDGQVEVSSVGIGPWHVGEPMDRRAASTLAAHGYPTDHVARQVSDDVAGADLLLAATADHARDLRRAGADPEAVRLLRSFDPDAPDGAEVPDPYYGGDEGFDEVLAMIEAAAPGVVAWARETERRGARPSSEERA